MTRETAAELPESARLVIGPSGGWPPWVMPAGPIERMAGIGRTIAGVRQSDDMQGGIAA